MSIYVSNGMDSHIYVYTCPTCMYVCVYQERKHSCQDRLFCVNKMKKHCMREVENNWMCVCVCCPHIQYFFMASCYLFYHSLVAQRVKRLPATQETRVQSLGWEDPLEKEMATHSDTLAWKIPCVEKPGRL